MIPCPPVQTDGQCIKQIPRRGAARRDECGSWIVARCSLLDVSWLGLRPAGIGDMAARREAFLCLLQIDDLRRRHMSDVQGRHELHTRLHGGSSPSSLWSGIRYRFERNVWLLSASYLRPYRALTSYDIARSSERSEGIGGVEQAILRDTGVTELWIPAGPGSLMTPHPHSLQSPKSSRER